MDIDIYQAFYQALLPFAEEVKEEVAKKINLSQKEMNETFERVLVSFILSHAQPAVHQYIEKTYKEVLIQRIESWTKDNLERCVIPEMDYRLQKITREKSVITDLIETAIEEAIEDETDKVFLDDKIQQLIYEFIQRTLKEGYAQEWVKSVLEEKIEELMFEVADMVDAKLKNATKPLQE